MRVAVTGATGFIGRYIVRWLSQQGESCRAWFRDANKCAGLPESIEWISGGLADADSMDMLVRNCDAVIHAALDRPGTGFRGAEGDIVQFADRNVLGTLRLIEAAKRAGVGRFVFVSTCAIHEKIFEDRRLDERHSRTPLTHYGAHKGAIEMFIHSYGWGEGWPICSVRPTGVYGMAQPVEASKWYGLVQRIVNGDEAPVRGGGKEVHALDVARAAHLLASQKDFPAGECFNCYDRYVSQYEVATIAKELSGSASTIVGEPKTPKHTIETDKIKALGMDFGGTDLLRATIQELVTACQNP